MRRKKTNHSHCKHWKHPTEKKDSTESVITITSDNLEKYPSMSRIGAHAKGYNRNSIGICYEGGLDKDGKIKLREWTKQFCALM